jgi:predicted small metal-binding protein
MKTMTCDQLGGPCDASMTAGSEHEMMTMGMQHVEEAHPEMAEKIKAMSKEETDAWATDFHSKWEAAPEDESDEAPEVTSEEEEEAA